MHRHLRLSLLLLFVAPPVFAGQDLVYTPPPMPEPPSVQAMLVRLFIWTGILIVICLSVFWLSRRWQKIAKPGMKSGGMEYVGSVALNRQSALHLIEANGRRVVIATDLTGLKEMHALEDSFASTLQHLRQVDRQHNHPIQ